MLKKNDFVEIDYTGKFKDDNEIFDTTKTEVAKENDLYDSSNSKKFGPLIVCLGHGQIISGLEKAIEGKNIGDEFTVEIIPEEGFGKKSSELINLVPANVFKKQNIRPMSGLHVNIDDNYGVIKNVSGGRVIVDFNHPFSGKDLIYDVKILRIIDDVKEKVKLLLQSFFRLDSEVELTDDKKSVKIKLKLPSNVPKEAFNDTLKNELSKKIKEIVDIDSTFE